MTLFMFCMFGVKLFIVLLQLELKSIDSVGSPYEMGFAHGVLLKDRASDMLHEVWNYFELQVVNFHGACMVAQYIISPECCYRSKLSMEQLTFFHHGF